MQIPQTDTGGSDFDHVSDPGRHRHTGWNPLAHLLVGGALLIVGVAGLVLPILPGWVLILAALVVFAGAVPPLRNFVSRLVASPSASRVIAATASSPSVRKVMSRALASPLLRRGLTTTGRWTVLRHLIAAATATPSPEKAQAAGSKR